ncbi:hypothetical protein DFP73DRAFT_622379 [Morchella snyderi]|nr:hypothetical protein DFP73DRAFT_622379 [Morchella snyderi]
MYSGVYLSYLFYLLFTPSITMAPNTYYYRINSVPASWPASTLLRALMTALAAFATLRDTSMSLFPAPAGGLPQTPVIKYNGILSLDQTGVYHVNGNGYVIEIDNHSQGTTQLNVAGDNAGYEYSSTPLIPKAELIGDIVPSS